jgi:hypothetical protein
MNEDQFHELARLFMYQFTDLKPLSLDEFLMEYRDEMTDEQYQLGMHILELFNNFYFE